MRIRFFTEGGGDLGLGHVVRCLTLAEQFPEATIHFSFTRRVDSSAVELVRNRYAVLPAHSVYGEDFVVRDLAGGARAEQAFPGSIVIDLADEAREIADDAFLGFSFVGTPHREGIYSGMEYAILRKDFSTLRKQGYQKKDGPIVVSLGGVDPSGATVPILRALGRDNAVGIVGSGYRGTITSGITSCSPNALSLLLYKAPLVVCSGGMTLLECAAMGTPALVVAHNVREEKRVKVLAQRGFFEYLGRTEGIDLGHVRTRVGYYMEDEKLRTTMGLRAWDTVGTLGASRVKSLIYSGLSRV